MAAGLSPRSIDMDIRPRLERVFLPWCAEAGITEPDQLDQRTVNRFSAHLQTRSSQRGPLSPHTIASYRDTFSLLLRFTQQHLGKAPSVLTLDDLDVPLLSAFLDDLEHTRGTSARSRNVRLAAIHAFFHYAQLRAPSHSGLIQDRKSVV